VGKSLNNFKNQLPHFLDVAEQLSSDAWIKWSQAQEKKLNNKQKILTFGVC